MAGRTSASHTRHDARAGSTAKHLRKSARNQQHRAAEAPKSATKVRSNAQAQDSARDVAETEPWEGSESDSTLDSTSNDFGDIERAVESDASREHSDIERAH